MVKLTVINTSPLIFLTKAGLVDLLQVLSPEIAVPTAVCNEIYAYGEDAQMLNHLIILYIERHI